MLLRKKSSFIFFQASDIVASKILDSTEEGKKVTRNKGDKFVKVFRRINPKFSVEEWFSKETTSNQDPKEEAGA